MIKDKKHSFPQHEIVTMAVHLLGGEHKRIELEDIAVKANELAPGRFSWRKYKDQISQERVRKRLWDATRKERGGYLSGSPESGWILTIQGVEFCQSNLEVFKVADLGQTPLTNKEKNWIRRERERMTTSEAYAKYIEGKTESITNPEAELFFRLDTYVTGKVRKERLLRARNLFRDDTELASLVNILADRIEQGIKDE